jgi:hypothetical protein
VTTFPTWLTGPNGERRVFERAEDVPEGWVDGLAARDAIATVKRVAEGVARDAVIAGAMGAFADAPDTGPAVADPTPGHSDDLTAAAEHIGMRRRRGRRK